MALTKKGIETLSVDAVRDSIMMADLLDQYIPDNDKEPFWDGAICVFSEKSHTKETFMGRMPVQVKGTENNDFSKDEIKFRVSTTDLKGYLKDGGAIFFVVYIGNNGLCKKIYYIELTPIRIRVILDEAKGQKSKFITLKTFPTDNNAKTTIFMNCLQHCKKQASFSEAQLYSLDELQEQGVLEKVTIPFSGIGIKSDPQKALMQNDLYIYAKIKGNAILQPLPFIPRDLQTTEEIEANIVINGKVFYESIRVVKNASSTRFILGDSFTITSIDGQAGVNINYKSSDKVSVLCKDLDFMLTLLDAGYFESNGHRFDFPSSEADYSNFKLEEQQNLLNFAKKAKEILTSLNCHKDLSMKNLQEEDIRNVERLYSALIENKPVTGLKKGLQPVCKIKVGNLNFAVYLTPQKGKETTYVIRDFFNSEVLLTYQGQNDKRYPISQYALLKADDLLNTDNVNWQVLLPSFQQVEKHEETFERANWFLLELLTAYDKSNNKEILEVAKDFSEWIMTATEDELSYNIRKLNQLQIIKRMRDLNAAETKSLYQIILGDGVDDAIFVGAYLLLGEQKSAEEYFEKLPPEMQDEFKDYPIYHFWKKSEDENNG